MTADQNRLRVQAAEKKRDCTRVPNATVLTRKPALGSAAR